MEKPCLFCIALRIPGERHDEARYKAGAVSYNESMLPAPRLTTGNVNENPLPLPTSLSIGVSPLPHLNHLHILDC